MDEESLTSTPPPPPPLPLFFSYSSNSFIAFDGQLPSVFDPQVLQEGEGHNVTIELKTGQSYRGKLVEVQAVRSSPRWKEISTTTCWTYYFGSLVWRLQNLLNVYRIYFLELDMLLNSAWFVAPVAYTLLHISRIRHLLSRHTWCDIFWSTFILLTHFFLFAHIFLCRTWIV